MFNFIKRSINWVRNIFSKNIEDKGITQINSYQIDWGTGIGQVSASDIPEEIVGSPTLYTVNDDFITRGSSGVKDGTLTYVTVGSTAVKISVVTGEGYIRTSNDQQGALVHCKWDASVDLYTFSAPASGFENIIFIGIEYSGGAVYAVTKASFSDWNWYSNFPLARCSYDGTTMRILNAYAHSEDVSNLTRQWMRLTHPFIREEAPEGTGGLELSVSLRALSMTGGKIWHGFNNYIIVSLSSGVAFDTHYRRLGGGFNSTIGVTAFPNTQWDDGSGTLQDLTNNRYGVLWVYLDVSDGTLDVIYGAINAISVSSAQEDTSPSIPGHLQYHGRLIARIIFQKSGSTATLVESAWNSEFSATAVGNHNLTSGLQGGTINEYYHLTSTEYSSYNPSAWNAKLDQVIETDLNFSDITTGNASASEHGLLPKLSNVVTEFFNGQGAFSTPVGGSGSSMTRSINQVGHGLSLGNILKCTGSGTYGKAQADTGSNAEVVGMASAIAGVDDFTILFGGYVSGLTSLSLSANTLYFLSPSVAGGLTSTDPLDTGVVGQISKPVLLMVTVDAGYFFNFRGAEVGSIIGSGSYQIDQTPDNGTYSLLSGTVNGSNKVFTTSQSKYVSGTLQVFLNGQMQAQGTGVNDWAETTPGSGTFTFVTAPITNDIITAYYQSVVSTAGNAQTVNGYTHDQSLLTSASPSFVGITIAGNPFIGRNFLINGGGMVNQRVSDHTLVKDIYGICADRFYGMSTGTAVSAGTLIQGSGIPCGITGYGFHFYALTLTGTGIVYLRYRMESKDAIKLKNKIASFSSKVYQDTGGAINYTVYIRKANGLDEFSTVTAISNSGSISVLGSTETDLKYENISMGDCSNGVEIEIKVECGAITLKNFYFTELQFELGTKSTAFEPRSYAEELSLCQRYYENSWDDAVPPGTATYNGFIINVLGALLNGLHQHSISYKIKKRIAVTPILYDYAGNINKISTFDAAGAKTDNAAGSVGIAGESSFSYTITGNIAGTGCHWTANAEL